MIHVTGSFAVRDPADYLAIYSASSADIRRRHGCVGSQLYRVANDDHAMVILLTWPSRAAFDGFHADPAIRDCMRQGGMLAPPVFTIRPAADLMPHESDQLEKIAEFTS